MISLNGDVLTIHLNQHFLLLKRGNRCDAWAKLRHGTKYFGSRDHLFFECHFSATIWKELTAKLLNQRYTNSFDAILSTLSNSLYENTTGFILWYVLLTTVYMIWHERNRR